VRRPEQRTLQLRLRGRQGLRHLLRGAAYLLDPFTDGAVEFFGEVGQRLAGGAQRLRRASNPVAVVALHRLRVVNG
jgi:hypothetical protein